jgi:hypothetical protein
MVWMCYNSVGEEIDLRSDGSSVRSAIMHQKQFFRALIGFCVVLVVGLSSVRVTNRTRSINFAQENSGQEN